MKRWEILTDWSNSSSSISPLLLFIFSSYVRSFSKLWKEQSTFLSTKVQSLLFRARLIQMCDTVRKIESHITQHMNRPCWLGYVKIVMYCTSQSQNTCSTLVSTEGKHFLLTKLTYRNRFPHSFSLVERGGQRCKKTWKSIFYPFVLYGFSSGLRFHKQRTNIHGSLLVY